MVDIETLREYAALCEQLIAERERLCRLIGSVDVFQRECFKDLSEIEKGSHPQEYRTRIFEFSLSDFLAAHKRKHEIEIRMREAGLGKLIVKLPLTGQPSKLP